MRQVVKQSADYDAASREILRLLNERGEMSAQGVGEEIGQSTSLVVSKLKRLRDQSCVTYRSTSNRGGLWTIVQTDVD